MIPIRRQGLNALGRFVPNSVGPWRRGRFIAVSAAALFIASMDPPAMAAAAPLSSDAVQKTRQGASYTAPGSWTLTTHANRAILSPPEADLYVAIVDVPEAKDSRSAAAAAWKMQEPGFDRPTRLGSALPPANGWDERWNYDYLTSPSEQSIIQAVALRRGTKWTVVLLKGAATTADKRAAAIRLVLQSLTPQGYARESFAGKAAHRLDPARIAEIRRFLESSMKVLGIPGLSAAIVDHGKIVFEGGLGLRQLGRPAKVDARTLFMIGSNTKSLTTLLLATAVDRHELRWDQPVTEAYPGFRLGDHAVTEKVRIKHLVCACTGLPRQDLAMVFAPTAATPPKEVFSQLSDMRPTSGFGDVFQYSNLLASAGGYVAAHVIHPKMELGAAYDRAMEDRIFRPLGMNDTTFSMTAAIAANHASPHGTRPDGATAVAALGANEFVVFLRPGGGAWSSAHDMIRYVQAELSGGVAPGGRIVSAENMLVRREPGVGMGENRSYRMGLINDSSSGVRVLHHGGSTAGYKSDFFIIPEAGVGALILMNADSGAALMGPFMRRLLEVLYDGKPEAAASVAAAAAQTKADMAEQRARLTIPASADAISNLASHYSNPELGPLEVRKSPAGVFFRFRAWSSPVASRKNSDGTTSLVTVDPVMSGFEFEIKKAAGKDRLIIREGQREYLYTPAG